MTDVLRATIFVIGGIGAVAQGLAAWWWFQASRHEVPDNQDTFISALREIGHLNTRAALAQSVAAACAVLLWLVGSF